jgi:hypothetical protein
MTRMNKLMGGVIKSVLNDNLTEAKVGIKKLIAARMQNLVEFNRGAIRIIGDDIMINKKRVGSIENDLNDFKRGMVITLDDGEEHEFDTIEEMYKFLMDTFRVTEGYRVMPSIDRERYTERQGLEGPFTARNGKVVYYDPKEGKYYDPDSDVYISFDEWDAMDKERFTDQELVDRGRIYKSKAGHFKTT